MKRLDRREREGRGGWAGWGSGAWQGRGPETEVSSGREATEHPYQDLEPTAQEDWGLGH